MMDLRLLPVANPSGKVHYKAGEKKKNITGAGAAANNMLRHALILFPHQNYNNNNYK